MQMQKNYEYITLLNRNIYWNKVNFLLKVTTFITISSNRISGQITISFTKCASCNDSNVVFEEFANSDCATMVSHRPRHKFIKIYEKKS
jgi:hypothetical protein